MPDHKWIWLYTWNYPTSSLCPQLERANFHYILWKIQNLELDRPGCILLLPRFWWHLRWHSKANVNIQEAQSPALLGTLYVLFGTDLERTDLACNLFRKYWINFCYCHSYFTERRATFSHLMLNLTECLFPECGLSVNNWSTFCLADPLLSTRHPVRAWHELLKNGYCIPEMSGDVSYILCGGSEFCWQLYKNLSTEEKEYWVTAQETLRTWGGALAKQREHRKGRILEVDNTVGEQTLQDRLAQSRWEGRSIRFCLQIWVIWSEWRMNAYRRCGWNSDMLLNEAKQVKATVRWPIKCKEPQALNPQIRVCFWAQMYLWLGLRGQGDL